MKEKICFRWSEKQNDWFFGSSLSADDEKLKNVFCKLISNQELKSTLEKNGYDYKSFKVVCKEKK
jgi:hypothetical protein